MFQRDFIMRQIEQLVTALIEILHLRRGKKFDAAQRLITKTAQSLLGFGLDIVDRLSTHELLHFLEHNTVFDTGKSYIIGRLLLEEAAIAKAKGQRNRQIDICQKALLLLLEPLLRDNRFGSEDDHRIVGQIIDALIDEDLPIILRARLMDYFEAIGAYARAEDILLLASENAEKTIIQKGHGFYLRLSAFDDEQLKRGNFSRLEVDDGLAHFQDDN